MQASHMCASRLAPLAAPLLLLAACVTGSTFRSGVGDAHLESPPYYAGVRVSRVATPGVVHLPIGYQRGAAQSPIFDPAANPGTPTAALLAEMNAYLDSLSVTTRIDVAAGPSRGTPADVHFGCQADPSDDDCEKARAAGSLQRTMRLAVGRPSTTWVEWAAAAADRAQASAVLVLSLETSQYWTREKDALGRRKAVELGTEYSAARTVAHVARHASAGAADHRRAGRA